MRWASRVFILAILFSLSAAAQVVPSVPGSSPQSAAKPDAKCTVEGKVVRASDGNPIKKAAVTLMMVGTGTGGGRGGRPPAVLTDAEGKFVFSALEPGRYQLMAGRNGYVRQAYGQSAPNAPGTTLSLSPGQKLKDVLFRLMPAAVISGHIVDEDGEVVAGAQVRALRWGYRRGRRELMPTGFASSNDLGDYRIAGLAAGRYVIAASIAGPAALAYGAMIMGPGEPASDEGYAPIYYPNAFDASQATALEVHGGEEMPGINFRLVPSRAVRVRGVVRTAGGEPARNIFLQMMPRGGGFVGFMPRGNPTDERGAFEIPSVMPGSYVLVASASEGGKREWARQAIEVGDTDIDVSLLLQPEIEIAGQVRLEGLSGLGNSTVRVSLQSADIEFFGGAGVGSVQADLTFKINNILGGDYTFNVMGLTEDMYVKSVRSGNLDVLRDGLSIQGKPRSLEVVISANGGEVEGTVNDSQHQAIRGAQVVLVPDPDRRSRFDLYKSVSSDQYGHFLLRGVTPGTYKLFAFESVEMGAWQDPDFLAAFEDFGQTVQVGESGRLSQELKVIPGIRAGQ